MECVTDKEKEKQREGEKKYRLALMQPFNALNCSCLLWLCPKHEHNLIKVSVSGTKRERKREREILDMATKALNSLQLITLKLLAPIDAFCDAPSLSLCLS